jgi:ABC-2 type transport system ATP-binding protein
MIEIDQLTHIYPGRRSQSARRAIDSLSLKVADGQFCILSGPNGSGKSTLFRILCGMARPSSGTVRIAGHDLLKDPAAIRKIMAVVFQSPAVDKHLSVLENLRLHAALYGIGGREFRLRQDEALGWTEIKDRLGDRVGTLSGGLARQVELAKCLLTRPRLLLLDEPTTGLDPASRASFLAALRMLQAERGITVLMTTHIFSEAEEVDRVAIMKAGRLLAFDSPQHLRARLGREMVVVQSRDAEALAARIHREMGLSVRLHGDEIRLGETVHGGGLPLLEDLLVRYRVQIESIAIKQPGLEDVFIHLTSAAQLAKDAPRPEAELLETGS